MVCVKMLWTYLIQSEFYFFICCNDNFMLLNKLMLKYQDAYGIDNNFITANKENFLLLREYFRKNAQVYQYLYTTRYPKYFCRIDNRRVKSKLAFELAFAG